MRKIFTILLGILALTTALYCAPTKTPQQTEPKTVDFNSSNQSPAVPLQNVPDEYKKLYQDLGTQIDHFQTALDQKWDHSQGQTIFATELAFANGNAGESLLNPITLGLNKVLLDRLQEIGVKGVTISLKFPLLQPDFPRSSEYLKFYKSIMAECRRHNMKVLIETGAIFSGTAFSSIHVDWTKYTSDSFLKANREMLVMVANELKPDYLTLTEEPATQEALTKLKFSRSAWDDFVKSTLSQIEPLKLGILIGVGSGSWEDPSYINSFINLPEIDYVDLHIYPPGDDGAYLERTLNTALEARRAGKRFTVGECWLYKASKGEMGAGIGVDGAVFNRDVYGFWYPLDAKFIQAIMNMADAAKMDYVSFFWMREFFAYLDYNKTPHNLSTAEINRTINQIALSNVQDNRLSSLGQYYSQQLHSRTK